MGTDCPDMDGRLGRLTSEDLLALIGWLEAQQQPTASVVEGCDGYLIGFSVALTDSERNYLAVAGELFQRGELPALATKENASCKRFAPIDYLRRQIGAP